MFQPTESMTLDDAYQAVSKVITDNTWKKFASTSLQLGEGQVEEISRQEVLEQKMKIFKRWEAMKGEEANVEAIFTLLNEFLNLHPVEGTSSSMESQYPSIQCGGDNDTEQSPPSDSNTVGGQPCDDVTPPQSESDENDQQGELEADALGSKKKLSWVAIQRQPKQNNFCARWIGPVFKPLPVTYPVGGKRRGCALIINNRFKGKKGERRGSEIDVENMKMLWTYLGCDLYEGKIHEDKTAKTMNKLLFEVSQLDRSTYSYIVVVIMTHGRLVGGEEHEVFVGGKQVKVKAQTEEMFLGNDGEGQSVQGVLKMFCNTNALKLHNIPKLFFLHFCRGENVDTGTMEIDAGGIHHRRQSEQGIRIPTISDILVAYPTHFGNAALRNTANGSWYINALTNVFMRYAHSEHVVDMLTRVNDSMATMDDDQEVSVRKEWKAMSHFQSSLRKKLYFCPQ